MMDNKIGIKFYTIFGFIFIHSVFFVSCGRKLKLNNSLPDIKCVSKIGGFLLVSFFKSNKYMWQK